MNEAREVETAHEPRNQGILIGPESLRLIHYNFNTLYVKIETSPFMCPELRKLLDHCNNLREAINEGRTISEHSPLRHAPVRETLFLLDDALNGKLTRAEFESKRQKLISDGVLGNGLPMLFKLGLLLVIVGTVLAAAGLFLTYGGVVTVSAVVAKNVLEAGLGSLAVGSFWCLRGRAPQLTRLTADVAPALYHNARLTPALG